MARIVDQFCGPDLMDYRMLDGAVYFGGQPMTFLQYLLREVDAAFAHGDLERCIVIIEELYNLYDDLDTNPRDSGRM